MPLTEKLKYQGEYRYSHFEPLLESSVWTASLIETQANEVFFLNSVTNIVTMFLDVHLKLNLLRQGIL
jgi:hypothetical protein